MQEITLKDVYEAINRVEDKLDKRIEKLEMRVSSLERFEHKVAAIVSFLAVFFTLAANYVWNRFFGK